MNYETGSIESDDRTVLIGHDGAPRTGRRRLILAIVAIVVVAAVAWFAFGRKTAPAAAATSGASAAPNVTVIAPGRQTVDATIAATGTLAARRDLPVGVAGEGGEITRVLVQAGDWVRAGQVLATVDRSVQAQTAASLAAQVDVAKSDQSIAQSELDRAQSLVGRGFISKADLQRKQATLDAASARVKVARATLAEAQARNGRLDIRAPAEGLVLTRNAEPGQIVSAGSGVLFRIAMGGQMEMQAQLSEADLATLHAGARATVTPVGATQAFPGQVWQVSPVIDPQTRQGIVRIAVPYNPAIRPGGFASANIVGGATTAPMLPDSALQSDDKGNFVYIVGPDDVVTRRDVKVGQVLDDAVVIAGGLDGTERVVRSAGGFLAPGQKVKPVLKRS